MVPSTTEQTHLVKRPKAVSCVDVRRSFNFPLANADQSSHKKLSYLAPASHKTFRPQTKVVDFKKQMKRDDSMYNQNMLAKNIEMENSREERL